VQATLVTLEPCEEGIHKKVQHGTCYKNVPAHCLPQPYIRAAYQKAKHDNEVKHAIFRHGKLHFDGIYHRIDSYVAVLYNTILTPIESCRIYVKVLLYLGSWPSQLESQGVAFNSYRTCVDICECSNESLVSSIFYCEYYKYRHLMCQSNNNFFHFSLSSMV
jgi:hypothetical protein